MKCAKCGKKLKNNEKFCTYCGYYNDESESKTWDTNEIEEELSDDDNWYDEDNVKDEDDEVQLEPVKQEPKKKEKKPKKDTKPKTEKTKEPKPKKEKIVEEIKIENEDEFYNQNDRYIEAYIGEDYKIIKKSPINIWAFLLNWMYVLYRKLYITGIIGLVITALVAFFLTKYFLIYAIIVVVVLGIGFNPYYLFIINRRVNKLLYEYEGSDPFTLEGICKEHGGVSIGVPLIIYLLFLVAIILSVFKPVVTTPTNTKYWDENSENKANCTSIMKLVYNQEKSNFEKITEGICKVNKARKTYELYLKANKNGKTIYVYYETEKDYLVYKYNTEFIDALTKKQNDNIITEEETQYLRDIKAVITNYEANYKKSKDEDQQIKDKTNKEEKLNYIFTYEELIR